MNYLRDQYLNELRLAEAQQSFGNDQTARVKLLANSMLNDGREDQELIEIYLADDSNSKLIHEQLHAFLKKNNAASEHPEDNAWIILHCIITALADSRKSPDHEWNIFIGQNWNWYEHVRRDSVTYAIEELLFLLDIYNYQIQQYKPRLTDEQEMITFNGMQQSIRNAAQTWLQTFESRPNEIEGNNNT